MIRQPIRQRFLYTRTPATLALAAPRIIAGRVRASARPHARHRPCRFDHRRSLRRDARLDAAVGDGLDDVGWSLAP
jgi:hypothetical protein